MTTTTYSVSSLFSGIAGLDSGFGSDVTVHKDSVADDEWIAQTATTENFVTLKKTPFKTVFQNDVLQGAKDVCVVNGIESNYHVRSIEKLIEENHPFPKADVVIGGFPCQPFSQCGKRQGFDDTKLRGMLYKAFVAVVEKTKPKVFVAENVYGIITMAGNPIQQIIDEFSDIGYRVKYQVVKANEFGVPQTRKRVIIMGVRASGIGTLPEDWNVISENRIECCVGKYFEHLLEPCDTTDVSQKLHSNTKRLKKGQGQGEIKMRSFAPTIRAGHQGQIEFRRHAPNEDGLSERRLSLREAGLIQTFPPTFVFTTNGTMTAPYRYIGNAVPPLLGYIIARKVESILRTYFECDSTQVRSAVEYAVD